MRRVFLAVQVVLGPGQLNNVMEPVPDELDLRVGLRPGVREPEDRRRLPLSGWRQSPLKRNLAGGCRVQSDSVTASRQAQEPAESHCY